MIKWLMDNWIWLSIFAGVAFVYFFVFAMCSVSHDADERAEHDIVMMRKTSASERDGVTDPHDMGGI